MFLTMVGILGLELGFSKLRDDWKNSEELKEKRREIFFQREKQILNEKTISEDFNWLKARESQLNYEKQQE